MWRASLSLFAISLLTLHFRGERSRIISHAILYNYHKHVRFDFPKFRIDARLLELRDILLGTHADF